MTDDERAREIDRKRRERELALLLLLLAFAETARQFAGQAIRHGTDPIEQLRKTIYGDAQTHRPGVVASVAKAIAGATIDGADTAAKLVDSKTTFDAVKLYEPGLAGFAAAAQDIATRLYQGMANVVQQAIDLATGKRTFEVAQGVRDALARYGYAKRAPQDIDPTANGSPGYAISALATDAILTAGNAGMWTVFSAAPDVALILRHHSVMDMRTTEICEERNGLTLPASDPYWRTGWPQLHRRCRSIVMPTRGDSEISDSYPQIPPSPGFGQAPAIAFGFKFS